MLGSVESLFPEDCLEGGIALPLLSDEAGDGDDVRLGVVDDSRGVEFADHDLDG